MKQSRPRGETVRLSRRAALAGGQPISQLMRQALLQPDIISLAAGFVDPTTLPLAPTDAAMRRLMASTDRGRQALQYGTTAGLLPLRERLLANLQAAEPQGPPAAVEQLVVTAGSNQLLHLLAEVIFDPGDIVLCATPSYFVFLGTLANLGARSIGVATDERGIDPAGLLQELERLQSAGELERVKAIYCVSYYDNPTSISLAEDRRAELVQIAREWSLLLIEDAAYRPLRYRGPDLPSLRSYDEEGDHVIYVGTFSKSFSPGLRVGWGILPTRLVQPVLDLKGNIDFGSPNMAQHLIHDVLAAGDYEPHLAQVREGYRAKLDTMLEAAEQHFKSLDGVHWNPPDGGLYLWLNLPATVDTRLNGPLMEAAMRRGMFYVPGSFCYPAEGPQSHSTLRLSFGVESNDRIHQGMQRLAEAIVDVLEA